MHRRKPEPSDCRIWARLTKTEIYILRQAAKESGKSLSHWIRDVLAAKALDILTERTHRNAR